MNWTNPESLGPTETPRTMELSSAAEQPFLEVERDYIGQINELHPETWAELSPQERLDGLRELETRLAEIEGRPPVEVQVAPLGPGERGYFDLEKGVLVIGENPLLSATPNEAIETVAQEGRYAYQEYVMHHEVHDNPKEVDSWRENFSSFFSVVEYGFELYNSQPLIADAVRVAASVASVFLLGTPL